MGGVTYDTGALVAAERNNRQMWALHAGYLAEEVIPTVPAAVLAQGWRGGSRQASLSRLLRMCDTEPMSENLARDVGVLAGMEPIGVTVTADALEAVARSEGILDFTTPKSTVEFAGLAANARIVSLNPGSHGVGTGLPLRAMGVSLALTPDR